MNLSLALDVDAVAELRNFAPLLSCKDTRARWAVRAAKYVDLFLGYAMRAEMAHGWWGRDRRVRPPHSGPPDSTRRTPLDVKYDRRYDRNLSLDTWLVRCAVPMGDATLIERANGYQWLSGDVVTIATLRANVLARYSTTQARDRLEEETGYRHLWTPEECLDASRVYPRKSVAARFCIALADLCHPERRVA